MFLILTIESYLSLRLPVYISFTVSETQKLYDDVNMGSEKINKTKVLSTYRWEIKQLLLNAIISAGMKVLESVGFDLNS